MKKRQKQNEILTNKELTDNLFNIAKEQKSDDLDKYNYIKERLDTTGRASIRQDEFDFVQEFEKKQHDSNLEYIKSISSFLKDIIS